MIEFPTEIELTYRPFNNRRLTDQGAKPAFTNEEKNSYHNLQSQTKYMKQIRMQYIFNEKSPYIKNQLANNISVKKKKKKRKTLSAHSKIKKKKKGN